MKKYHKKAGKSRFEGRDTEEREFKIRTLKNDRRDKYKMKNQRIHQWVQKDMYPENEDWSDYDHRA